MADTVTRVVSDEERRDFLKVLGITGAAAAGGHLHGEFTLEELRDVVTVEASDDLAAMGAGVRADLTGKPDGELLRDGTSALGERSGQVTAVRAAGVPDSAEAAAAAEGYGALTGPAWLLDDHLAGIGFYESAEAHLPPFTAEHVAETTRALVGSTELSALLSGVGFDEHERTAMVVRTVADRDQLAQWAPTQFYEEHEPVDEEAEIDPEGVPPLHRRAAAGSLLWIDGLDGHLWQNEVLLTDEILDAAAWNAKAMLGGYYLLAAAAEGIARGGIADEELTALVSGSTAVMIAAQTALADEVIHVTDEMRAPAGGERR